MKWYENVNMLKEILENTAKELEEVEYGSRVWYLLTDESNLIKNHLELIAKNQELKEENNKIKKAIEIIKKKRVDIGALSKSDNYNEYNHFMQVFKSDVANYKSLYFITEKEFDLLKEVLENES